MSASIWWIINGALIGIGAICVFEWQDARRTKPPFDMDATASDHFVEQDVFPFPETTPVEIEPRPGRCTHL